MTTKYITPPSPSSQSTKISVSIPTESRSPPISTVSRSQPISISTEASTTLYVTSTNKLAITSSTAASTSQELRVTSVVKESITSSSVIEDIPTSKSTHGETSTAQPTTELPAKGTVSLLTHLIIYTCTNLLCFFITNFIVVNMP